MTIGERIEKLRLDASLSRRALADASGVSESTIKQYENNLRQPQALQLEKLADTLHVSVDFLLGRTTNQLSKWRQEQGKSLDDLARDTSIPVDQLKKYESWNEVISFEDRLALLRAGIPAKYTTSDYAHAFNAEMEKFLELVLDPDNMPKLKKHLSLNSALLTFLSELKNMGYTAKDYSTVDFSPEEISHICQVVASHLAAIEIYRRDDVGE